MLPASFWRGRLLTGFKARRRSRNPPYLACTGRQALDCSNLEIPAPDGGASIPTQHPKRLSMYAVIETGGKQYRVAPGESVEVETLVGDIGAEVEFDRVVAVMDGDAV